MGSSKKISYFTLILSFIAIALQFFSKIQLITADLGRHISNGEFILEAWHKHADLSTTTPLFTNFYSYTQPLFPTINHHWLTGVIHYLINENWGFAGLTIFNATLATLTALFFFLAARKLSNFHLALIALLICAPIFSSRHEVRPEIISNFLLGIYFYLLSNYRSLPTKLGSDWLWLIPVLQLAWVNLHIFFVFGLILIGIFWLEKRDPKLLTIGIVSTLVCLINPSGLAGFLEPFGILREYGYQLAENQSIFFMIKRFPGDLLYYHVLLIAILAVFSFPLKWSKDEGFKMGLKRDWTFFLLTILFTGLALKANRSISSFAFIAIPMIAMNLQVFFKKDYSKLRLPFYIILILLLSLNINARLRDANFGWGCLPGTHDSAMFFKANNIQGPIFNNYDIGGYLIYHLFPYRRVFVDNRPEAYSVDFFKKIYMPMQADERVWRQVDNKYNFNVIYFMRHDMTEHAQPFLIRRIRDPLWAPVFVDIYTIILLKRNKLNREIIKQHELPQYLFKSVPGS